MYMETTLKAAADTFHSEAALLATLVATGETTNINRKTIYTTGSCKNNI